MLPLGEFFSYRENDCETHQYFSQHCKAEVNYRIGNKYTFSCCYIVCSCQAIGSGWYIKATWRCHQNMIGSACQSLQCNLQLHNALMKLFKLISVFHVDASLRETPHFPNSQDWGVCLGKCFSTSPFWGNMGNVSLAWGVYFPKCETSSCPLRKGCFSGCSTKGGILGALSPHPSKKTKLLGLPREKRRLWVVPQQNNKI